jgi:hypothetical protein
MLMSLAPNNAIKFEYGYFCFLELTITLQWGWWILTAETITSGESTSFWVTFILQCGDVLIWSGKKCICNVHARSDIMVAYRLEAKMMCLFYVNGAKWCGSPKRLRMPITTTYGFVQNQCSNKCDYQFHSKITSQCNWQVLRYFVFYHSYAISTFRD